MSTRKAQDQDNIGRERGRGEKYGKSSASLHLSLRKYLLQTVEDRDKEPDIREPLVVQISNSLHKLRRGGN